MATLVNRSNLARSLGITTKQVDIHKQAGRFLEATRKGRSPLFDLDICSERYKEFRAEVGRKRSGGVDKLSAMLRKCRADLEESTLKLQRLREDVVDSAELEQTWTTYRQKCVDRLIKLPDELAPELVGIDDRPEIYGLIERGIYGLLTDISALEMPEGENEKTE